MKYIKQRFTGKAYFPIASHKVPFLKVNFKWWQGVSVFLGPNSNLGNFAWHSVVLEQRAWPQIYVRSPKEAYLKELLMKGWRVY